jgi:hypothetical protein
MHCVLQGVSQLFDAYRNEEYDGLPLGFFGPARKRFEHVRQFLCVTEYTSVKARGVLFRSAAGRKLVYDNTGIMLPFETERGVQSTIYGRIQKIYDCPLFPESPIVEVEWFKPNGAPLYGRLPRVKKGDSDLNRNNRFWLLSKAWCQNVVFWPENMESEDSPNLLAIYRSCENRVLDR